MSLSMLQHEAPMVYSYNSALHLQFQQQKEKDRRVLHLNNRACVMVLSKGDYSEANKLFDSALMIHKEQTEEGISASTQYSESYESSLPQLPSRSQPQPQPQHHECYEGCDASYDNDFSEGELDEEYDDFGEMDWDNNGKDEDLVHASIDSQLQLEEEESNNHNSNHLCTSKPQNGNKIPRMTSSSRLQSISYSGQQEYHEERCGQQQKPQHHQVYSLPIVMEETEWDTAPVQDKSFVLIFNTALCNHLWGMQLMQQYLQASSTTNNNNPIPSEAMAQHCRETLTVSKLLYKLALENSVSFSNGVDKMCYVALYNNLSHVCKTLDGYESMEAQWCDDMLLKAIFWWRDSTHQHHNNNNLWQQRNSNNNNINNNDIYLDDDLEIMDAFFDNVYYRIGVPEDIAPAAAA